MIIAVYVPTFVLMTVLERLIPLIAKYVFRVDFKFFKQLFYSLRIADVNMFSAKLRCVFWFFPAVTSPRTFMEQQKYTVLFFMYDHLRPASSPRRKTVRLLCRQYFINGTRQAGDRVPHSRRIQTAGVTADAFYGYYNSKADPFKTLIGETYDHIMNRYRQAYEMFEQLPAGVQPDQMGKNLPMNV